MSRNTSEKGNTAPRLSSEKALLINVLRYVVIDLQGTNQTLRIKAREWLYDSDDYDYSFPWVMMMLCGRVLRDAELSRIRERLSTCNLVPKWQKNCFGDKSGKVVAIHRRKSIKEIAHQGGKRVVYRKKRAA